MAILILAATWFAFECAISWAAFCDQVDYASSQNDSREYDCIFRGPGISLINFFFRWWAHVFHGPDAYVALFTAVLAFFTLALWRSTDKLWEAGERQFRLARDEFISSHRPEMRLKHMWSEQDILDGQPIEVTLDIVNVGKTDGRITLLNFVTIIIEKREQLPQRPPYDEPDMPGRPRTYQFKTDVILPSGVTFAQTVCDGRFLTIEEMQAIITEHARLYFIGTIEYWDAAGRVRQTAFCRYLSFNSTDPKDKGRFKKHKDPDYEYQD
jgi:hypothetical protein